MSRDRNPLCYIPNCGEFNYEQKSCDEATQLERRFGSHFEKIAIRRVAAGRHLEFFARHVTEALCVIYQILWNLIMNREVGMKQHNWSDGFGVILKRMLFVEKEMAAGRHLEFDTLVPRAQLCPQVPNSGPLGQHLYQISALHSKKKRTFTFFAVGWATRMGW